MLRLFGRPALTTSSGVRVDLSPSGWRLLAAVAAGPAEGVSRLFLAELVSPAGKLSSLRKHMFDLRRALDGSGLNLLDREGDALRLSEDVSCDVRDLRAERLERASHEIYRGAFFDAQSTFRHGPWTTWLAEQRRGLLDLYIRRAGDALASFDGDRRTGTQEARHLLKFAPDHVGATACLMVEAGRASDADEVQRVGPPQACHNTVSAQADRRMKGLFHSLVGTNQRPHRPIGPAGPMDLPTVHVCTPPATGRSRAERMLRSLLVDITIGLCRARLLRVIASDRADAGPVVAGEPGQTRSYRVATSIIDHVLGPQVVFTLLSHPEQQVLWTEKVEAAVDLTVSAYNLLTAGVLRSLVEHIKEVELEAFRLDADPGAYALYLAGYSSLGTLDLAQLRRGRRHLRRALSQSPDFAPIPSALARSLQLEWLVTGRGERDLLADARGHALRAIAADPHEARGFKALAFSDLYEQNNDTANYNYARPEQLNTNYAQLVAEHANCLLHCGLAEEALVKVDYAMRLNPEHSDMYRWTKASACFFLSRYDEVLEVVSQMKD